MLLWVLRGARLRIQSARSTETHIRATPPITLPAMMPASEVPPPLSLEDGVCTTDVEVPDVVGLVVSADVVVESAVVEVESNGLLVDV